MLTPRFLTSLKRYATVRMIHEKTFITLAPSFQCFLTRFSLLSPAFIMGKIVVKLSSNIQSLWQSCCQISWTLSFRFTDIHFHVLTNIFLFVGIPWSYVGPLPRKESWIQVLVGIALLCQRVGSFLRTPCWQIQPEKG